MDIKLTPYDLSTIKYAQQSSVDVNRSFRCYKSISRPNHRSFKFKNLQMYDVSNCLQEDNNEDE